MLSTGMERVEMVAVLQLRWYSSTRSIGRLSGSNKKVDETRRQVCLPTLLLIVEDIQREFVVE